MSVTRKEDRSWKYRCKGNRDGVAANQPSELAPKAEWSMTLRQILRLLSLCCRAKGKKLPANRKPGASRPLWNVWSHTACQIIPSIPVHTPKLRNIHTIHLHTCKNTTSSSANPRAEALRKNVYFPHPLSSPLPRFALTEWYTFSFSSPHPFCPDRRWACHRRS